MPSLALIAALPAELKPLVRAWQKKDDLFQGRIGSTDAVAFTGGMGAAAATRACERMLARCPTTWHERSTAGAEPNSSARSSRIWEKPIDTLVSIGYAGSVSCGLQAGAAYAIREVVDAATGERFATDLPAAQPQDEPKPQRLITLDRVADADEKRRLAAQHQAVLVDMEAAAIARFAREHNLRFLCFKAVTDGPNDKLPDFNRFIGAEGEWCMTPFIFYAATHPASWSALRRLRKNSRAASRELANLVHRSFEGTQ
jgi:adenosylhomocysteine nucleosidase